MRKIWIGIGTFIVLGPAVFGLAEALVESLWHGSWQNFTLTFILATCMAYTFGLPLVIGLGAMVGLLPRPHFYQKIVLAAFSFGFLWHAMVGYEQTVAALSGSHAAVADWLVWTTLTALCCTAASVLCALCVQRWRPW